MMAILIMYHVLKPIVPTTDNHPHDKVVVVTLVRRPHCVLIPFRADSTTSPIVLNMSKTIGEVWRSVRISPSLSSSIKSPTYPLHDVHVYKSRPRPVLANILGREECDSPLTDRESVTAPLVFTQLLPPEIRFVQ